MKLKKLFVVVLASLLLTGCDTDIEISLSKPSSNDVSSNITSSNSSESSMSTTSVVVSQSEVVFPYI